MFPSAVSGSTIGPLGAASTTTTRTRKSSSSSTSSPSSTTTAAHSSGSNISGGAIAGAAVGSIAGAVAIGAIAGFFLFRRYKSKRTAKSIADYSSSARGTSVGHPTSESDWIAPPIGQPPLSPTPSSGGPFSPYSPQQPQPPYFGPTIAELPSDNLKYPHSPDAL